MIDHISSLVRGRRKDRGLSQELLALRAGVSREFINRLEQGEKDVNLAAVSAVLGALGFGLEVTSADQAENKYQDSDWRSLAMHRIIARKLRRNADVLKHARANIKRWRAANQFAQTYLDEWEAILDGGVAHTAMVLESPSQKSARLRSSSPFAGVLEPDERMAIMAAWRRHES